MVFLIGSLQRYWQVEVKEEDKPKTAFTVGPLGFFECNRMPFCLTNSPATFQYLMEKVIGNLNLKSCLVYLDDIVIFSSSIEEHLGRLREVLIRLHDAGIKPKPSKCHFLQRRLKYLGHIDKRSSHLESANQCEGDSKVHRVRWFLLSICPGFCKNCKTIASTYWPGEG